MKAVLICPSERPGVPALSVRTPLATAPILGRSALENWIEVLVGRGVKEIVVLAADRPNRIRETVGDGRRWGVHVEIVPVSSEPGIEEVQARLARQQTSDTTRTEIILIDHLPGQPQSPLFETYAGWFAAQRDWMAGAVTAGRIGVRQITPGVWAGLRADVHPSARLSAPCWIGDFVRIGREAVIGPGAIIDDRSVVDEGARVVESVVSPDTYVGKFVSVERSLAACGRLTNWRTDSTVVVPDPFLMADLTGSAGRNGGTSWPERIAASLAMIATAPFAIAVMGWSLVRGESPWQLRLGLNPRDGNRRFSHDTFGYYELTGARNWLRRWPQFWSVLRGDMRWFGNRPLRPTQAMNLTTDFERLWLAAPVGLISLSDAHGCPDAISEETIAHASYYAVHAGRRLHWYILTRSLLHAAMAWPMVGHRRKEPAVPLQDLVPKQEV